MFVALATWTDAAGVTHRVVYDFQYVYRIVCIQHSHVHETHVELRLAVTCIRCHGASHA